MVRQLPKLAEHMYGRLIHCGGVTVEYVLVIYILSHAFLQLLCGLTLVLGDIEKMRMIYATQSDNNSIIAYLKVSRNVGFKYSVCYM